MGVAVYNVGAQKRIASFTWYTPAVGCDDAALPNVSRCLGVDPGIEGNEGHGHGKWCEATGLAPFSNVWRAPLSKQDGPAPPEKTIQEAKEDECKGNKPPLVGATAGGGEGIGGAAVIGGAAMEAKEEAALGYKPQDGPVAWGTTANGKS